MWRTLQYYDENGNRIKHLIVERKEQILCETYILPTDCVLELGARYGTVSCVINKKLSDQTRQVSVEPDERVWIALEANKLRNNCHFNIVNGFISKKKLALTDTDAWCGYGTSSVEEPTSHIPSFTLEQIEEQFQIKFNVLVADCEGFLETFLDENPTFLDGLRLIIFEKDNPKKCNYKKIKEQLKQKGFCCLVSLFREAWVRS